MNERVYLKDWLIFKPYESAIATDSFHDFMFQLIIVQVSELEMTPKNHLRQVASLLRVTRFSK